MPKIEYLPHPRSVLKYTSLSCSESNNTGSIRSCVVRKSDLPRNLLAAWDIIPHLQKSFEQFHGGRSGQPNPLWQTPRMYIVGGSAFQAELPSYQPTDLDILVCPPELQYCPAEPYIQTAVEPWFAHLASTHNALHMDDPLKRIEYPGVEPHYDPAMGCGSIRIPTSPSVHLFARPNGLNTHRYKPDTNGAPSMDKRPDLLGYFHVVPTALVSLAAIPVKSGMRFFRPGSSSYIIGNDLWSNPHPNFHIFQSVYFSRIYMKAPGFQARAGKLRAWFENLGSQTGYDLSYALMGIP